ncbi:hypothetical protein BD414DRAFT_487675 [Trametes punicea]|nr:hypothetical protein BD414DRAFT_487675 [Trametes punicea]
MARYCRAIRRFFPTEPVNCNECGVLLDRAHVLLRCPRHCRWWELQGEFGFLQRLNAYNDVAAFLRENESAFAFADAPVERGQRTIRSRRCGGCAPSAHARSP